MQPGVMVRRPAFWLVVGLLAATVAASGFRWWQRSHSEAPPGATLIRAAPATAIAYSLTAVAD